jgi:hypothetical protein
MRVNITEPRQTTIPSNVEREAKPVVAVVPRDGEARKQKGRLGGRTASRNLLGVVQKNENEEEMLDNQKRERYGGSKSETPIEMEAMAIETIERMAEDVRRDHRMGHNRIWMR